MFTHRYKCTCNALVGKIRIPINHVLIAGRWHSFMLDVQSFREVDRDTDHCLLQKSRGMYSFLIRHFVEIASEKFKVDTEV